MNQPENTKVAARLDELAVLVEAAGASRLRVAAYHRAARVLREMDERIGDILAAFGLGGVERLSGISGAAAEAIRDLLVTGRLSALERLRSPNDPVGLLASVPGIGPMLAARLHDELGIETLDALDLALRDGRLAAAPGFGAVRLRRIAAGLEQRFSAAAVLE
jgi:DNA polymerase/3'-5' exonuclease PolX